MATQTATFPAPGDVFESRYRIERLIGAGGFSRVYLATQTDLGRRVALKVMLAEKKMHSVNGTETAVDSHGLTERFLQEARVVSKLRDPHTVTVHDHGQTNDGHFFMVLEFIDGETLSQVIKAEGALDPRRVAKILEQTLESLHEAHLLGLMHRDIKPANIMLFEHLGRKDNVKVLDFGIAKLVGREVTQEEDLTRSGSILGTPRYMSPEQLRGETVGAASDVYSLGLVAYEMLVGKKAIDSNSSVVIIGQQLAPRSFAVPNLPHIPPRLRMIVNRMLSKETNERYVSAEAVLADLQMVTSGNFAGVQVPSRTPNLTPMDDLPDLSDSIEVINYYTPPALQEAEPDANARTIKIAGVFLLVCMCVLVIAVIVSSTTKEPPVVAPPVVVVEPPVDPPKVPIEPVKPAFDKVTIDTGDTVAKIYVNGKPSGDSPVVIATADINLPLRIRAVAPNGGERMVVLDSLIERIDIDLKELASQAVPPPVVPTADPVVPKDPKTTPRKDPKRDPKRDPDKNKDEDKDKDNGTTFKLPALDY